MKKQPPFFYFLLAGLLATGTRLYAQASRPNILVCVADDASYPFMSAYGCPWVKTPAFDWVASHGILFNNAYTPNAKCGPSRSCIITGRNSWQLEAAANHWAYFPQKFKSYAEALKEHGYYTGYTGKGWAPGVAGTIGGKKRELTGKPFQQITTSPPTSKISKIDYAANFRQFMQEKPPGKPFCFWYGAFEPHRGYEYGSGIRKGGMKLTAIKKVPPIWPDNDTVRTDMLDYAFELEYFDHQLMKILNYLKESGELDNTLIIVTADNGMPFPRLKGQEYDLSNHEPLAVMWKDGIKNPGRIVSDFVSFIDFAPTILEIAGLDTEQAGMQPITGESLTDIFYSPKSGTVDPSRTYVLIGKERHDVGRPHDEGYPIRGIVTRQYLYLHNFETGRWPAGNPETGYLNADGGATKTVCIEAGRNSKTIRYWQWSFGKRPADELYQLESDRDCLNNLSSNEEYSGIMDSLKARLFNKLKEQADPRMFGRGHVFDRYLYADTTDRDFYERFQRGENLKTGWVNKSDFDPGKSDYYRDSGR